MNPLLEEFKTPFGAVPFDLIKKDHFKPALTQALQIAEKNIIAIINNQDMPNFKNTISALEDADYLAARTMEIYDNLYSLNSDQDFKALAQELNPLWSAFQNRIFSDQMLFKRINQLYKNQEKQILSSEEKRLLEKIHSTFIRNGALLNKKDQTVLEKIDKELSQLIPNFSSLVLDATNDFELYITNESQLEGLPPVTIEAAKEEAKKKGKTEGWILTLQPPCLMPVLTYAKNREIRKTLYLASSKKNIEGKFNNCPNVLRIIELRQKRAHLLGYKTHADYVLEKRMAATPQKVFTFIEELYQVSYPAAKNELEAISQFAKERDDLDQIENWDLGYYSNRLKQELFDYDPEEFRPWLKSEKVVQGIFAVANKMYGLSFIENNEVPLYHPEVKCYEVKDSEKNEIGLLYTDIYPRETKRGGAWMSEFQIQGMVNGEMKKPHVVIAGNLTPSTPKHPSLLSLNDANTLFHEFGHALHGLLSNVKNRSLASPSVYWDFVELPSQVMENWLLEKETLDLFASHYETGEPLPTHLLEKANKSKTFNKGLFNLRQLSLGYLDMKWHTEDLPKETEVVPFEKEVTKKFKLLPDSKGAISPSFSHLFAGGYSAGYYSYKWAELLDADAFELFKEKGIFNPEVTKRFRKLLSAGNSVDPMKLYIEFRGCEPDSKAALRRDGLI